MKSLDVLLAVVFVAAVTFGGVSPASAQVDQGAYGQGPGAVGVAPSQPPVFPGVTAAAPGVASVAPGVASAVPGRGTGLLMGVELPRTGGAQEHGTVVSDWLILAGIGLFGLLAAIRLERGRARSSVS